MMSRRDLIRALAGSVFAPCAGLAARPAAAQEAASTPLVAGRRTIEVNGRAASVFGLTQQDGTHGLSMEVGAPFRVTLRNQTGLDTLIHWHGLTPPYQQDGVPGLSGPPIAPGAEARYDFPLPLPGTFWMHSHQGFQEQSLLSAPLIVRPRGGLGDRQEVVLMLHDFAFRPPEEIHAGLRRGAPAHGGMGKMDGMAGMDHGSGAGMAMDLNDVTYDAFLANDRTLADPQVVRVEPAGRILLRVINAAAASNFRLDLGPVRAILVAVDGQPVRPVPGSAFPIAMAQRLDLAIDLRADQTVVPVTAILEGERRRTGIVLATARGAVRKLPERAARAAGALDLRLERSLRAMAPLAARTPDRIHRVDLTGDMASYSWGLGGASHGAGKPLMVRKGERVEMVMTNRTMMSHPMHLHGHAFQVVAIDGRRFAGALRDTVLVPPMTAVTIAFAADNPGRWAFHCHNLYHMEAGMMTTVQYEAA